MHPLCRSGWIVENGLGDEKLPFWITQSKITRAQNPRFRGDHGFGLHPSQARTKYEPMKPAPPLTTIVIR